MKVLIFSMTCGEGHNSISKSIKQGFEDRLGDEVECKVVQTYGYAPKKVEKENKAYLNLCKYVPGVYHFVWNRLRQRNPQKISRAFLSAVKKCGPYFVDQIKEFNPDVIVCTHFYASTVITELKKKNLIDDKIITSTILTDYSRHPYWEFSRGVDYVFTPREENTEELTSRLFKREQIINVGMPVRKDATINLDSLILREKFGLTKFTGLICGGGNGLGKTLKTVKNILKHNPDINLIVINGRNQKSFNQIEKYKTKNNLENIINLGFVTNIIEYISASDVVFSRGGALSLTESLCQHKPIIIREKMIINEKINKQIFIEKGCALGMNKTSDAGRLVKYLHQNPKVLKSMEKACKEFAKPNASEDIVKFLIDEYNKRKEQK